MSFVYSDELLAELMVAFSTEGAEQLQALNQGLLALEQGDVSEGKAPLLQEMFRHAHTLKGGAAAVDLPDIKELAHHLESLFGRLQSGEFEPRAEDFDVLYRVLDALEILIGAAAKGEDAAGVDVGRLSKELQLLTTGPTTTGAPTPDMAARLALPEEIGEELPAVPPSSSERRSDTPASSSTSPSTDLRGAATEEVVRISTAKLDAMMSEVGELLVARGASARELADLQAVFEQLCELQNIWRRTRGLRHRLVDDAARDLGDRERLTAALLPLLDVLEIEVERVIAQLRVLLGSLESTTRRADQITSVLHDDLRRARMLPLASILGTFPRMVRDLAREQAKEVTLQVTGEETELDRAVLEQIKAPLMHLLRNSVDHGLEEPAARRAAGKPEEATIALTAVQAGDNVRIEIADDGQGIDLAGVTAAAVAKGVITADDADKLTPAEALSLIFRSGFSTSPIITDVSGRGVGLDVVRENVEGLGGRIEVDTDAGRGTRFSLILPLTVAVTSCLLVRVGAQRFAVPINNMIRVLRLGQDDVHEVQGGQAIKLHDDPIILGHLADELQVASQETTPVGRPALVLRTGTRTIALIVDEVLQVQELVVKGLPPRLAGSANVGGAALLDTGEAVVVLNVADVGRSAHPAYRRGPEPPAAGSDQADEARQKVILLADDSLTTRTLEKNILQAAGYEVRAVGNGQDAWDLLQREGVDLLVSDVQMPRLDGFDLSAKIRSDARFQDLPVVLVTSLDSPADRRRGIEAGADAYIVKSGFDQEHLIDVIRRLI